MDSKLVDFFTVIGYTSASQILLLIVVGFFGRKLIEYFFSESIELKKGELNQEFETHKQKLTAETHAHKLLLDKNLEEHKNELQKISYEHQIKFSKLHTERGEVIKVLFSKLIKMDTSMKSLMAPFQPTGEIPLSEKAIIAAKDANDFIDYYKANEIFFNQETFSIIDEVNKTFKDAWRKYNKYQIGQQAVNPDNEQDRLDQSMKAYFDILNGKVPELKNKLIGDFRKTLGVI